MKPLLHVLQLDRCPIYEQLQLEEALLRTRNDNWCIINHGSTPAIVMGISGKPELLVNTSLMQQKPIPLIRRFSGGGTVIVDHDTYFVTFICQKEDAGVPCSPGPIMRWAAELHGDAIGHPEFHLREHDFAIGNLKCGGNAQYLQKDRWLHHTSFLWDYQSSHMEYLLIPPRMPEYRQQRSHADFLCRLSDHIDDLTLLSQRLVQKLSQQFTIHISTYEDAAASLAQPHRKSLCYVY